MAQLKWIWQYLHSWMVESFKMNHAAYWVYPEMPSSESKKSTPIKFWLVGLCPGVYILNIGGDRLRVDHVFCGHRRRFYCHVCWGEKERCWRHNTAEKRETDILSTSKYLCWSFNSLHFAWLCTGNGFLLYIPFIVVILKYFCEWLSQLRVS